MPANMRTLGNFIKMLQSGENPQQIAMNMIQNRISKRNPLMLNLLNMAQAGDSAGIEQFARNIAKEKGEDYDTEFNAFRKNLGI